VNKKGMCKVEIRKKIDVNDPRQGIEKRRNHDNHLHRS
jgi:hypothetical protein